MSRPMSAAMWRGMRQTQAALIVASLPVLAAKQNLVVIADQRNRLAIAEIVTSK